MNDKRLNPSAITDPLLCWYATHRRMLPFRDVTGSNRPYAIWISEIMAQQTRIAQLLPYYERFMNRFPNVEVLANATEEAVLKVWEGLGYYTRARNLHRAAQIIVRQRGGRWPERLNEWRTLPGVGAYTAGAIMSIAYGVAEPAIDGNVLRVYARLTADDTDIAKPEAKTKAAAFVKEAMPEPPESISRFAQALMELGALVCVPARPLCLDCPLSAFCCAYQSGTTEVLPYKSPKKPQTVLPMTVLLITDPQGRVLVRKRKERLLGGMWVFHLVEEAMTEERIRDYVEEQGYFCTALMPVGKISHAFTHLIWQMEGFWVAVTESHVFEDYVWMSLETLAGEPIPVPMSGYYQWLKGNDLFNHE